MTNQSLFLIWFSATSLEEKLIWLNSSDAFELLKEIPQSWHTDVKPKVDSWIICWKEAVDEDNINKLPDYFQEERLRELVSSYFVVKRLINHNFSQNIAEFLNPIQSEWLNLLQNVLDTVNNIGGILEAKEKKFYSEILFCKESNRGYIYAPFLHEVRLVLEKELNILSSSTGLTIEHQSIINNILEMLAQKCDIASARALSQQFKFSNNLDSISKYNSENRYTSFFNLNFFNHSGYTDFLKKFPVLARIIAQYSYQVIYSFKLLVKRLSRDWSEIVNCFFKNNKPTIIYSIKIGLSDSHNQGLTVVLLRFNLKKQLIYKPKDLNIANIFQELLCFINQKSKINFPIIKSLVKKDYGYVEYISHCDNCKNIQEVNHFYKQMGGYLAILKLLSGTDMHSENLIASHEKCYLVDLETLLIPKCKVFDSLSKQSIFNDSSLMTGLLRYPTVPDSKSANNEDISGLLAGKPNTASVDIIKIINDGTDLIEVVRSKEADDSSDSNRIKFLGKIINPSDFRECIEYGFAQICNILNKNSLEVLSIFENVQSIRTRYLIRSTLYYDLLSFQSQKGLFLQDALYVDLVLARLWRTFKSHVYESIILSEIRQIWNQDIPFFILHSNSRYLYNGNNRQLVNLFSHTGLEELKERIQKLQYSGIIAAEQSLIRVGVPTKLETKQALWHIPDINALNIAIEIGELLIKDTYVNQERYGRFVNASLHSGTAGISLFFSYLAKLTDNSRYKAVAEKTLQHAYFHTNFKLLSAFNGMGGLIYLLANLYNLSKEEFYLKQVRNYLPSLEKLINIETKVDVISGTSGLIPILLSLANAGVDEALNIAALCGEHIIKTADFGNNKEACYELDIHRADLSFSHGTSGVGWALIKLGIILNREQFVKAGLVFFASENSVLNFNKKNKYGLRMNEPTDKRFHNSWRYGSPGIALARFQSWQISGKKDRVLKQQAETALIDTFNTIEDVSTSFMNLYDGSSGNCEIITEISILTRKPVILANARALGAMWSVRYSKNHTWPGVTERDINTGLMNGLAGIGMLYLRLAYPLHAPSVLALTLPECKE